MLEKSQATLDDNVLEDGTRGDVDGLTLAGDNDDGTLAGDATAEVDGTSDGQVVELEDLGDAGNAALEA